MVVYNDATQSMRAELYAAITCPPPPKRDSTACNVLAAAVGIVPFPGSGSLGALGKIGYLLGCS